MLKFPSDSDIVSCRLTTTVITGSSATGSRSVLTPRNIVKLSYYYITIRFYYSLYLGPDFELDPGEPLKFGPELWCGSFSLINVAGRLFPLTLLETESIVQRSASRFTAWDPATLSAGSILSAVSHILLYSVGSLVRLTFHIHLFEFELGHRVLQLEQTQPTQTHL